MYVDPIQINSFSGLAFERLRGNWAGPDRCDAEEGNGEKGLYAYSTKT